MERGRERERRRERRGREPIEEKALENSGE
jgi:hypothetical protein